MADGNEGCRPKEAGASVAVDGLMVTLERSPLLPASSEPDLPCFLSFFLCLRLRAGLAPLLPAAPLALLESPPPPPLRAESSCWSFFCICLAPGMRSLGASLARWI